MNEYSTRLNDFKDEFHNSDRRYIIVKYVEKTKIPLAPPVIKARLFTKHISIVFI